MYSVSDAFKNAIKEPVIEYGIIGQIGNTQFTEENVIAGSMTVSNQCTDTNDIVLGSAYIGQLTATFTGIQLNRYDWLDKVVSFAIRVQLPNNQHEDVPMGYYTIKEVYHTAEGVQIKAYDNMHKFDKLFDATHFDFNGKPYAFLNTICSDCGVTLGMSQSEVEDLPNGEHKMYLCGARKETTDYASDIETYRDALFYLAQACACFATIDRQGRLVLRRYRQGKVDTITELHRLAGAEFSDYVTSYNGLYVTSLWDGRTTYYGYDIEELQESRVEAIERQGEEQDAVDDIEAEIAELVRKHNAHEITDEEYAQQRAQLDAELQAAESTLKMTTKYIKWLDKAIAEAQAHGQGTFMDLGGNPFLQHKDSDLSPIADVTTATVLRQTILNKLSKIEYVPFSCSTVFGVHYDLGDRIMFSGGHADDDLGCIMSYDWTYNGQYSMTGFGGNPTETSSVVRPKADKEANRANINALNRPELELKELGNTNDEDAKNPVVLRKRTAGNEITRTIYIWSYWKYNYYSTPMSGITKVEITCDDSNFAICTYAQDRQQYDDEQVNGIKRTELGIGFIVRQRYGDDKKPKIKMKCTKVYEPSPDGYMGVSANDFGVFEEDGETVRNARQIIDPDDPTVTWFLYDLSMGYGAVARGIAEEYKQDYSDFYFNSVQAYLNAGVIFLDTIPDLRQGDVILPTETEGQNTLAKLKTLAQKTKVN